MGASQSRYLSLDFMRGIAIILMVAFHLCFNLNHFKFIEIDIYHGLFWHYFRYIIVTIFLLCVGVSLYLANKSGIDFKKVFKRFSILFFASLAITIVTYFIFPSTWIYFGILHFIAIASIIGLVFINIPLISLLTGLTIVIAWNFNLINMHWLFDLTKEALYLPLYTEDLVPFTPWLGVVLIGIFLGEKRAFAFPLKESAITNNIALLGRHSLVIYISHQPILFGSIFLVYKYLN